MFTIEDLKQGRCAVINDGTLEELREVLRSAFSGTSDTDGLYKFYYAFGNDWDCNDKTNLPTQSVKDFLTKELKRGDLVWVSDNDPDKRDIKAIYITKAEGAKYSFICVKKGDENCFNVGKIFDTEPYTYATKVEEPKEVEMTIQEIERALNIKNLKIVK